MPRRWVPPAPGVAELISRLQFQYPEDLPQIAGFRARAIVPIGHPEINSTSAGPEAIRWQMRDVRCGSLRPWGTPCASMHRSRAAILGQKSLDHVRTLNAAE